MKCPFCDGVGALAGAHTERIEPCPYCKGSGIENLTSQKVQIPPRTKVRTIRLGKLVYRSEKFPSGDVLRWITWDSRFWWRNDR